MTTKSDPLVGKRWHTLQGIRPRTATAIENGEPVFFASHQVVDRHDGMTCGDIISAWTQEVPYDWIAQRLTSEQRADLWALNDPDMPFQLRKDRDYCRAPQFTTMHELTHPGEERSLADLENELANLIDAQDHSNFGIANLRARTHAYEDAALEEANRTGQPYHGPEIRFSAPDYSRRISDLKRQIAEMKGTNV
jgi:hypothetical protein